jgi:A/G-specific adenine glycosylase
MDTRYFSEKLVEWYHEHKRELPWRDTTDPYKIWLSEIILQQTRVNQGLPYFLKFVGKFPDVQSLASASEEEVLRLWQGLGYYSRARNLHKCAKQVVSSDGGQFPARYHDLLELPGIGEYTAAAIASFSTKEKVAVVDGNVFRVLSRIYGESLPVNSTQGKKRFNQIASELIPDQSPDIYNQAIMEFGALWCTPKTPKCSECVFSKQCIASVNSLQHELPVKIKQRASRKRFFNYFVVKKGDSLLMKKREGRDIWNGLYDFYLVETTKMRKPKELIASDSFLSRLTAGNPTISQDYKHTLSHQTIISKFVMIDIDQNSLVEEEPLKYFTTARIHDLPKPVLISQFLKDYHLL